MLDTFRHATPEAFAAVAEEMEVRKTSEVFLLFAMGSQFDHLIFQALARLRVFCLVADPTTVTAEDVTKLNPKGVILSGGPSSAYENPPFDEEIFELGIPVLGICLGFQMWAHHIGVPVVPAERREFGIHALRRRGDSPLFTGLPDAFEVLESHGDRIEPDPRLEILGSTEHAPVAAARCRYFWGLQFHPETTHTQHGDRIFENFCFGICGAKDRYPAVDVANRKIGEIAEMIHGKKVLLALSGGSDSSVVAYLIRRAVERGAKAEVRAVYIRGVDRPDDEAHVRKHFDSLPWLELRAVDATARVLAALRGITDMPGKRAAFQPVYHDVLQEEADAFGADYVGQGSLYTDYSESGLGYASGVRKARIKLHHNMVTFRQPLLEPLKDCVKDNARNIGRAIGVPKELLTRHPFPGPGGVVRVEGEITAEALAIERAADGIYIEEMRSASLYETVWQAGAVVTQSQHTCTKGDDAATGIVVTLWAVWSVNGFTAQWAELPIPFLRRVSQRLTNEIRSVGAVSYRISDKPPATIEWG